MTDISRGGGEENDDWEPVSGSDPADDPGDDGSELGGCTKHPNVGSRARIGIVPRIGWQGISSGLLAVFCLGVSVALALYPAGDVSSGSAGSRILPSLTVVGLSAVLSILLWWLHWDRAISIQRPVLVLSHLLLGLFLVVVLFHDWDAWWPWPVAIVSAALCLVFSAWFLSRILEGWHADPRLAAAVAVLLVIAVPGVLPSRDLEPWEQTWFVVLLILCWASLCWIIWKLFRGRTQYDVEIVLGTLVLLVFVLTLTAYPLSTVGTPVLTQLYYTALSFIGRAPGAIQQPSHQLAYQLAQYCGLTVLFWVAIRVLTELLSSSWNLVLSSWSSNVTLINGLSDTSLPVVEALAREASDERLVVVEPDRNHPLIPRVKRLGVGVVIGDISLLPEDQRILGKILTRSSTARLLQDIAGMLNSSGAPKDQTYSAFALNRAYLLSENDSANIAKAEVIREKLHRIGVGSGNRAEPSYLVPPRVIVRIDRYNQGRSYAAEQVRNWNGSRQAPIFISVLGTTLVTARALVHHISTIGRPKKVFIVGSGDLAEAFRKEWELAREERSLLTGFVAAGGMATSGAEEQSRPAEAWAKFHQGEMSVSAEMCLPEPISTGWSGMKHLLTSRHSDRLSIVLTRTPTQDQLDELEAAQVDGSRVRIFVPGEGVNGIAAYPIMGYLQYFGLGLGGLEGDTLPQRKGDEGDSPLVGVPKDAWARAAEVISTAHCGLGMVAAAAGSHHPRRASGPRSAQEVEDLESNLRSVWHTLSYLSNKGYLWTVRDIPKGRTQSFAGVRDWADHIRLKMRLSEVRILEDDSDFDEFIGSAHESWLGFKQDQGWVKEGYDCAKCQKSDLMIPWSDLREGSELKERALRQTVVSIWLSLGALMVLGFTPRPPAAGSKR